MTNDLAYGIPIKKYGRERITYEVNKKEPAIIMFGAANYKTSMRNYSAVPKKSILRVLAQKTLVFLTSEYNTTKNCFKCGNEVKSIENTCEKKVGDRFFEKWSKSNLRNVRYCENIRCVNGDKLNRFYIGRDVNAANNILQNGLRHLSGDAAESFALKRQARRAESNLEHITHTDSNKNSSKLKNISNNILNLDHNP
jgi:hypothetical protein